MVSEIQIFQQVVGRKDWNSTSSVLEDSPFLLNLILNADIVIIIINHHHLGLPDAVMIPHFEVQLRVAVHHTTFLDHVLERTSIMIQRQSEWPDWQHWERSSNLCFSRCIILLWFGWGCFLYDGHWMQWPFRCDFCCRFYLLVNLFALRRGRHGNSVLLFLFLVIFDFALD